MFAEAHGRFGACCDATVGEDGERGVDVGGAGDGSAGRGVGGGIGVAGGAVLKATRLRPELEGQRESGRLMGSEEGLFGLRDIVKNSQLGVRGDICERKEERGFGS